MVAIGVKIEQNAKNLGKCPNSDVRSHVAESQEIFMSRDPKKARFIEYDLSFEPSTNQNGPVLWAVALASEIRKSVTHTDTQTDRHLDSKHSTAHLLRSWEQTHRQTDIWILNRAKAC